MVGSFGVSVAVSDAAQVTAQGSCTMVTSLKGLRVCGSGSSSVPMFHPHRLQRCSKREPTVWDA